MKTRIISTLKKELLIIELPEGVKSWEFIDGHFWLNDKKVFIKGFSAFHTLLGTPDEIKEDDARDLVESFGRGNLKRFKGYNKKQFEKTGKESLLSAIESEIFWNVNPLGNEPIFAEFSPGVKVMNEPKEWERIQAQEKTFDRKRTLIFTKNERQDN